MEKLFRFRDVADQLGTSERSVRRWVSEKGVKTVRLGRCVRIPESEMRKFIDKEANVREMVDKFTLEGG